jgi:hypothetical protein
MPAVTVDRYAGRLADSLVARSLLRPQIFDLRLECRTPWALSVKRDPKGTDCNWVATSGRAYNDLMYEAFERPDTWVTLRTGDIGYTSSP